MYSWEYFIWVAAPSIEYEPDIIKMEKIYLTTSINNGFLL